MTLRRHKLGGREKRREDQSDGDLAGEGGDRWETWERRGQGRALCARGSHCVSLSL